MSAWYVARSQANLKVFREYVVRALRILIFAKRTGSLIILGGHATRTLNVFVQYLLHTLAFEAYSNHFRSLPPITGNANAFVDYLLHVLTLC